MRALPRLLPLALFALLGGHNAPARAEPGLFNLLVGSYTAGSSQGLYFYRFISCKALIAVLLRIA